MINKIITVCLVMLVAFITTLNANTSIYADENENIDWNKLYNEENKQYKRGGINTFCYEHCVTQEDSDNLEDFLCQNPDYILINTYNKDISDKEWDIICQNITLFPYKYYLNSEFEFGFTSNKVYVYKPLYDIIMEHIKNGERVDQITQTYFSSTAVVVSDSEWFYRSRAEQVVQEFNDNFPIRYTHFGFIQFESPIDCEIKIKNVHDNIYNVIYVSHDKPFLIQLPYATYEIIDINAIEMPRDEETLGIYGNNTFYLSEDFTENNPKIITIAAAVEKYDIQPIDISDKPDFSWENRNNVTDEDLAKDRTINNDDYDKIREQYDNPESQPEAETEMTEQADVLPETVTVSEKQNIEKQQSVIRLVLLIAAAIIIGILIAVLNIIKKKNNKNNY